jgi:putative transposase
MKQARFSEEQIISILKEAEAGAKVTELCRLRQLEEENRRLKGIVADQALDIRALKDVLAKNGYGPR